MKIDIYTHVMPSKYNKALYKYSDQFATEKNFMERRITLNGGTSGLRCCYDFFGEGHLLFGSDMPYDIENGAIAIRETIETIEGLNISESSKNKIYEGNARNLLHL